MPTTLISKKQHLPSRAGHLTHSAPLGTGTEITMPQTVITIPKAMQNISVVVLSLRQGWRRIQSSELRSGRYRAGLKNQMISRVLNQASHTPKAIETSASTTVIQRTSAGAGCTQYAVLIKGLESDR